MMKSFHKTALHTLLGLCSVLIVCAPSAIAANEIINSKPSDFRPNNQPQKIPQATMGTKTPPQKIPEPSTKIDLNAKSDCSQECSFQTAIEVQTLHALYFQEKYISSEKVRKDLRESAEKCLKNGNCSEEDQIKMFQAATRHNYGKAIYAAILDNKAGLESLKANKNHDNGNRINLRMRSGAAEWNTTPKETTPFKFEVNEGFGKSDDTLLLGQRFVNDYRAFINSYPEPKSRSYALVKSPNTIDQNRFEDVKAGQNSKIFQTAKDTASKKVSPSEIHDSKTLQKEAIASALVLNKMVDDALEREKEKEAKNQNPSKPKKSGYTYAWGKSELENFNNFLEDLWPTPGGGPQVRSAKK